MSRKKLKSLVERNPVKSLILSFLLISLGVAFAHNTMRSSTVRYLTVLTKLTNNGTFTQTGQLTTGGDIVSDTDGTDNVGSEQIRFNAAYFDEMFWNKGSDVASAASAFTLGSDGNFYDITGTTTIDSIASQDSAKVVMLQFDGILTMSDGGNLKLEGDFVSAAGATITLISDGTDWYELARSNGSVNIQGAATYASTVTVGTAGSGTDVTLFSGTSGDDFVWDASEEVLNITGTNNQDALQVDDGDVALYDNMTVSGAVNFLADTSSTNDTYGGTIDPPLQAYATGTLLFMIVGTANTGACSVAPDGLTAKDIKTASGADPANSDLVTTSVSMLVYNGTNFILLNPATSTD